MPANQIFPPTGQEEYKNEMVVSYIEDVQVCGGGGCLNNFTDK